MAHLSRSSGFPAILGCDLAGEVVAVGRSAKRLHVGDAVFAMMPHDWGAQAELVALPEELVARKPDQLSMVEAGSVGATAITAVHALKDIGAFVRSFLNPILSDKVVPMIAKPTPERIEHIRSRLESGKLRTIIDRVLPASAVREAQEHSKGGRAKGKIVLTFND